MFLQDITLILQKFFRMKHLILALTAFLIFQGQDVYACKKKSKSSKKTADVIDQKLFNYAIQPSEDFFEYVNSNWTKQNPIPADKASMDMFAILDEKSKTAVKQILDNALLSNAAAGTNQRKLSDFYKSGMDTLAINKAGITAIQPWLNQINNIKNDNDFAAFISKLGMHNLSTPIGYNIDVDAKNTSQYILYLSQGGLGLPDKDYYTRTDEKSKNLIAAYKKYITQIFEIAKIPGNLTPAQQMENVWKVENAIAAISMNRVEMRDPVKTYNLMTIDQLNTQYPYLSWKSFFDEMKVTPKNIVVQSPEFLKGLNDLRLSISKEEWKSYLDFQLMNSVVRYLSSDLEAARFNFYGTTMSGIKAMQPRWKRVSNALEGSIRDIIGQEYVKTNFSPEAKSRAAELIKNIKASLAERIGQLSWMGAATKAKALDKLNKIDVKIGYPDKWIDYSTMDIKDQPYVQNVLNAAYTENLRVINRLKLDKIDRTEWGMGPQTVNAYYNPTMNEIVFPAAILQPPFFYANADDAVNYGGIGMVIGHEITHGFDDQGSQFDGDGALNDWWTAEDKANYQAMTEKFVETYNAFNPIDTLHINGNLTLGENIADLGGMIISYNALKKASPDDTKKINGLTRDQRFFINYAIIWRDNTRPEALRMQILSNEHSPAKYRVNGVLQSFPAFYKAFNVLPGHSMYKTEENRNVMW